MIKRALISVYDKTNLLSLANKLKVVNAEIIATGKTYEYLLENGIDAIRLSDYTGSPEILNGRVKTLHPTIHVGILADPDLHSSEMAKYEIHSIDLVVVNLYPFEEHVRKSASENEIIENIDIGGVSLLRSAAKNFRNVCVLSDPSDYALFDVNCTLAFRTKMARKTFMRVARYDCKIADWFSSSLTLPENINISLTKRTDFRYGENPHQNASFYSDGELPFKKIQGKELSYNNLLDLDSALAIVANFSSPACAIIKHNNPCGVSVSKDSLYEAYDNAFAADSLSAFGGVVAFNQIVTKDVAEKISKTFFEVVVATGITQDAELMLQTKTNLRVLIYKKYTQPDRHFISLLGGFLVQSCNAKLFQDFEVVTNRAPDDEETNQLIFAWKVCKYVKSNAIVTARNYTTVGIGAGQMSRVKSVEIALEKTQGNQGLVMASDAFFPFADSIELAAKSGVTAIIQPGGSIKDNEVIEAANKHNIGMIFTRMRHFRH
ncbi:phosphoribosylaminoimidazolecarboxamide formyltransferase/IMP cyclohydrolase [Neorickettsia helminthoeca str. Oregon]|uniref:Bifunctional purine biosynthesis protein PurH n=1 Tax=Neorickettsia helminthoeca str. Oregon TaxID=1286528 RepID=X5HL89_9RICK|nr:bifunctional phosphoribosylaminoimidazolecarboxamide formyltransferase/IMP cyclohydrolase [Neorickettsia helminthoeca]AHX11135.1 phosphoribosylaminoimidazolecarboxamide formyltransferase/IMP cyclohydrolase [Neorickettsia helminthoeca str. Oregon]